MLLAGEWRNTQLHLERFDALSSEWGKGSLQGDIDFSDNWPLHVDSVLKVAQPPLWQGLHGRDVSLQARGSLAEMQLHLVTQG
mgnify:FL=1